MEGATCCVAVIALCNGNGQETPVWYIAPTKQKYLAVQSGTPNKSHISSSSSDL